MKLRPQRAIGSVSDSALYWQVKEVTAFSQECLEKIDRCLMERDYQQVDVPPHPHLHAPTCTPPPTLLCLSLPQVLALCSDCLHRQQNLLAETHLYHLRVLSAAVEALSHLRRYPEAAAYAQRLLQGYR